MRGKVDDNRLEGRVKRGKEEDSKQEERERRGKSRTVNNRRVDEWRGRGEQIRQGRKTREEKKKKAN